ncbi:MAG: MFS transporter, partial [Actinobacteria bacterium]|nr:MFS transporter [Actinomycetota bacterium]
SQGFNSAALSIFDAVGSATAIAAMGLVFTALSATGSSFPAVFGIAAALAALALVPGLRLSRTI